MTAKGMMILRDVLYAIIVVIIFLPANPTGVSVSGRVLVSVLAVGVRIWQHINYYKATGKIY